MYRKIDVRVWNDEKFKSLSEKSKYFFIYLLTSPHSSACGAYILHDLYIKADLSWSTSQVKSAWVELVQSGLVLRDSVTQLVAFPNWYRYNRPVNEKSSSACINALTNLPQSDTLTSFCNSSEWVREQLANHSLRVREQLGGEQEQEQEQEQKQEQEVRKEAVEIKSELVRYLIQTFPDIKNPAELESKAKDAYPGIDLLAEAKKASAWEAANPSRKKVMHGRFLMSWWGRAQDRPVNLSIPIQQDRDDVWSRIDPKTGCTP